MLSFVPTHREACRNVTAGERLPARLHQTALDTRSVPGGQGVAGSNPAVPTQVKALFRSWTPGSERLMGAQMRSHRVASPGHGANRAIRSLTRHYFVRSLPRAAYPLHSPLRSTFLRVKAPRLGRPILSAPPGTSASATTSSALACPGRAAGHTAAGRPARTHPHRRHPRAHRRMPPSRNRNAHGCEDHTPGTPHRRTCCYASLAMGTRPPRL